MSRSNIACYLGLTIETVSRIFSRFQKMGLLSLENREIDIASLDWLRELANSDSSSRAIARAV